MALVIKIILKGAAAVILGTASARLGKEMFNTK